MADGEPQGAARIASKFIVYSSISVIGTMAGIFMLPHGEMGLAVPKYTSTCWLLLGVTHFVAMCFVAVATAWYLVSAKRGNKWDFVIIVVAVLIWISLMYPYVRGGYLRTQPFIP